MRKQWWLVELNQYGGPGELSDGPHSDRSGVERAAYLLGRLGLVRGRKFGCAYIEITDVDPKAHGANEDALNALNDIGLKPPKDTPHG